MQKPRRIKTEKNRKNLTKQKVKKQLKILKRKKTLRQENFENEKT